MRKIQLPYVTMQLTLELNFYFWSLQLRNNKDYSSLSKGQLKNKYTTAIVCWQHRIGAIVPLQTECLLRTALVLCSTVVFAAHLLMSAFLRRNGRQQ